MRCLYCKYDEVPDGARVCPNLECGMDIATMLRDLLPRGSQLKGGEYQLDWPLGFGSFGVTYRALHVPLERPVAIKEFFPDGHSVRLNETGQLLPLPQSKQLYFKDLTKFVKEAHLLALVNHPNVVRATDLFEENGTAYLVMDLIDGQTLEEELRAHPGQPLAETRVQEVMAQLVAALAAVHEQSIWHLDLKPSNVMIAKHDKRIVLVDFGTARYGHQPGSTSTTRPVATPKYAPLEVIRGRSVGPQSDIFELGMMLHEMLRGETPPAAQTRDERELFYPGDLREPWAGLLAGSLMMEMQRRPNNVAQWWAYQAEHQERLARQLREAEEQAQQAERQRYAEVMREWEKQQRQLERRLARLQEQSHANAIERSGLEDRTTELRWQLAKVAEAHDWLLEENEALKQQLYDHRLAIKLADEGKWFLKTVLQVIFAVLAFLLWKMPIMLWKLYVKFVETLLDLYTDWKHDKIAAGSKGGYFLIAEVTAGGVLLLLLFGFLFKTCTTTTPSTLLRLKRASGQFVNHEAKALIYTAPQATSARCATTEARQ